MIARDSHQVQARLQRDLLRRLPVPNDRSDWLLVVMAIATVLAAVVR